MPQIQNIVISAGRKVSKDYQVRETSLTVTLTPDEGESPATLVREWTGRLQRMVDAAVGDWSTEYAFGPTSAILAPPAPAITEGDAPAEQ